MADLVNGGVAGGGPDSNGSIVTNRGGELSTAIGAGLSHEAYDVPRSGAVSPQILWRTLRYKWTIALLFLLVTGALLPLVWLLVVPQYKATAIVRVSPVIQRVMYATEESGVVPLYTSYLNTQVSQILSPDVLELVLDRKDDVQKTSWYREGKQPFVDRVLARPRLPKMSRLLESLSASPRPRTELIDVSMTAKKPRDAKVIVDAVVKEYRRLHLDRNRQGDGGRLRALEQRIDELKNEIDTELSVRKAVSKQLGTGQPEELRKAHMMRLGDLESEFDTLQRADVVNKWVRDQYGKRKDTVAEGERDDVDGDVAGDEREVEEAVADAGPPEDIRFAADPEWVQLHNQSMAIEHELKLARERYGESHPRIASLISDVEYGQKQLLERETYLRDVASAGGEDPLVPATGGGGLSAEEMLAFQIEKGKVESTLLSQQIKNQQDRVDSTSQLAGELGDSEEKIQRLRRLEKRVRDRLEELEMERKAPGRVEIMSAMLPARPSKDRRVLFSVMVIFAGLCAGFGIAFVRASLDSSFKEAKDVAEAVRIPFLGQLPKTEDDAVRDTSDGLLQESLRMVRTALLERVAQMDGGCSVLITSPTARTGKTTLTIMLGRTLAQLGKRVLLIDADLRRSSLTERLCHEGEMGLTTILHGQATWQQVVLPTQVPGVDLIPVGQFHSKEDLELMADGMFESCLRQWKSAYDYILLDSPPVLPVADARILTKQVDGTILTVRASYSRRGDATESLDRIRSAGGELLGTVLVGTDMRSRYYGSKQDHDYYYYGGASKVLEKTEV